MSLPGIPSRPDSSEPDLGHAVGSTEIAAGVAESGAALCRDPLRLKAIFTSDYRFIWRLLLRLGVAPSGVDDAAQQVFMIAARKIELIAVGHERSFLFATAVRIASDARNAATRRQKLPNAALEIERGNQAMLAPDELLDRKRARLLLDRALEQMDLAHRTVFVSFELEGLTMAELSVILEIPPGTVASRLRRAREIFFSKMAELTAGESPTELAQLARVRSIP